MSKKIIIESLDLLKAMEQLKEITPEIDDLIKIEEESSMLRTRPESVADKVKELRDLADKMMRQGAPYCVDIHALAVDISEGLNLEEESNEKL
jgi:ppGpp synthetase/RelA/SpoT-type nucleotidyltranferase